MNKLNGTLQKHSHGIVGLVGVGLLLISMALAASQEAFSLLSLPSILMTLAITMTAASLSFSNQLFTTCYKQLKELKQSNAPLLSDEISYVISYSKLWFRKQFSFIDAAIDKLEESFLKKGLRSIRISQESDDISEMLHWHIEKNTASFLQSSKLLYSLSNLTPGAATISALICSAFALSQPSQAEFASYLASAFITCSIGLLMSFMVFKPLAQKLEQAAQVERIRLSLIAHGLLLIQKGRSPGAIRFSLESMLENIEQPQSEPLAQPDFTKSKASAAI